jgi:mRNA-degrading endonuclease HigB of HigAB toxin-antitoxin module
MTEQQTARDTEAIKHFFNAESRIGDDNYYYYQIRGDHYQVLMDILSRTTQQKED